MIHPKVSIVTVTYNAAQHVGMTLRSITSQNYDNLEIIVIDGGSRDGTVEIIEQYKQYISVFISEPDTGIYDAMNKGIKHASGDWIIFINAGDALYSNDVIAKVFSRNIEPDTSLIFGNIVQYSLDMGLKLVTEPAIHPVENGPFPYREELPSCHQATFYQTKLMKEHPYRQNDFRICADWESIAEILDLGLPYKVIPDIISWFQQGGVSSVQSFAHFAEKEIILGPRINLLTKLKKILLYKIKNLLFNMLPDATSRSVRKKYFMKKYSWVPLTGQEKQYLQS